MCVSLAPSSVVVTPVLTASAATILGPKSSEGQLAQEERLLIYRTIVQVIDALQNRQYSRFDALTTANCCHGIALRVHELITSLDLSSLSTIKEAVEHALFTLQTREFSSDLDIPTPLIELSKLFLLNVTRKEDKNRGVVTVPRNLCTLAPLSKQKCKNITTYLQRTCATDVAESYQHYFSTATDITVNSLPVSLWGKYVQAPYLRTNHQETLLASNLFSMEVMMGHLIETASVVALVCDLKDASGEIDKGRFVQLFRGNGKDNFVPLSKEEASAMDPSIPIVVLGGCTHSDELNTENLALRLSPWMDDLPGLVLANDVYYPQFPKEAESPVVPEEPALHTVIQRHAHIEGVFAANPSLFVLAHIFPSSLHEVLEDSLPRSLILPLVSKNIKEISS